MTILIKKILISTGYCSSFYIMRSCLRSFASFNEKHLLFFFILYKGVTGIKLCLKNITSPVQFSVVFFFTNLHLDLRLESSLSSSLRLRLGRGKFDFLLCFVRPGDNLHRVKRFFDNFPDLMLRLI